MSNGYDYKPIYAIFQARVARPDEPATGGHDEDGDPLTLGNLNGVSCFETREMAREALQRQYANMRNLPGLTGGRPVKNTLNDNGGYIKFEQLGNVYIRWVAQLIFFPEK